MASRAGFAVAVAAVVPFAAYGCTSLANLSGGHADAGAPDTAGGALDTGADIAPRDSGLDAACAADASFDQDPKNCGRCGHDCLGGSCSNAACEPVQIAAGQGSVSWVAVDTSSIYWTDGMSVRACSTSGCGDAGVVSIVEGRAKILEVAAGGATVFWTECIGANDAGANGVFGCPSTGCSAEPNQLLADGNCTRGIGLDVPNQEFYFTDDSAWIYRCPFAGCGGSPSQLVSSQGYSSAVFVEQTRVYWMISSGSNERSLGRCTYPYCSPTAGQVVATASGLAISPATFSGSSAYWVTLSWLSGAQAFDPSAIQSINGGAIFRAGENLDGGPAETLIGVGVPTAALAADGGLYFNDFVAGTISYCPSADCEGGATLQVQGQGKPFSMVQDDTAIYWGNWGDGRIMKLAK